MEREKKLIKYSDKLVIANDFPLKYLYKIDKLYFLKLLFNQVYITETVRKKCKFEIPSWIIIEEPTEETKYLISSANIDKGERSAIALVIELEILQRYNIVKNNQSLILVNKNVKNAKVTKKYSIDCINLKDIFCMAYYKKIFTKDEGKDIVNKMKDLEKVFCKRDLDNILRSKL
jgi:predicted nucleic acid-binding protein